MFSLKTRENSMTGPGKIISHSCPKCKTVSTPRGKALTFALTCKNCGLYFSPFSGVQDEFNKIFPGTMEVGTKATIDGKTYEVMGYTVKQEKRHRYRWTEYFLFSPYHGIAFLSEYAGSWNFLVPYANHPWAISKTDEDPEINGSTFRLYSKYQANVLFAKGEFFNDIIGATESSNHVEHIAPPYVLVLEKNDKSVGSYLGKYISPGDVAAAVNLPKGKLPAKKGMGYTEPILGNFTPRALIAVTVVAIALALVTTVFFNNNAAEENIMQLSFNRAEMKDSVKMFSTPSFKTKGYESLVLNVTAPLDNDWFFAEYSLINDDTGEEYVFTNEVEYYYGVSEGESWHEGSKTSEVFLSKIPPGKYHFDIYPEFSGKADLFQISVFRDAKFYGNFWVMAFGLLIFPGIYFSYRHVKEVTRWSDSEYSPYDYEEWYG